MNFNDIGANTVIESNAFKKIRMFSKTNTLGLFCTPTAFSHKYKIFSNLYLNDNLYSDSYLYGLKRQHNFLSHSAIFNNSSTFLNLKSLNKFLNFNLQADTNVFRNTADFNSFNFFKKPNNSSFNVEIAKISNIFLNTHPSLTAQNLQNSFFYTNNL
jgi:hypothetical protein